ncbi:MAG: chemotaxis response regulator protein-glutamate methylesterase [Nitrospinae bacterium]|nr:chemotaxis response regulator protein-glutamate methylesterase [Nitrospinota bacterium]
MEPAIVRVLVVDDSPLVRDILARGLSAYPEIEVVGSAGDPYEARDKIVRLNPDVVTLDVQMPKMDGVEFLRRLMPQYPVPVVMVSSFTRDGARTTLEALEAGAVDFVAKPTSGGPSGLSGMISDLAEKIMAASTVNVSHFKKTRVPGASQSSPSAQPAQTGPSDRLIAIGASTGGTEAIRETLSRIPPGSPGVVVVQHMPSGFTKAFADRLNEVCALNVREAANGDVINDGEALIAQGDIHMRIVKTQGVFKVSTEMGEKVKGHRPSVDVMMSSVASAAGDRAVGVVLTGMGSDGARGLKEMRQAGARTLAQDEETSVVFGMPREAFENGGAERLVPLGEIPASIMRLVSEIGR